MYFLRQSRAVGWSCLSAVTAKGAKRVRAGAGLAGVGAGRCCSHNAGAESDSSADQYFRNHLAVLSRHVILFPQNKAVVRLDTENSAPRSPNTSPLVHSDVLCYLS